MSGEKFPTIEKQQSAEPADQSHHANLVDLAGDFGRGVMKSGVQDTFNGASQLLDHVTHTNLLGQMHTFDSNSANGGDNTASRLGTMVGMLAPFMIASGGLKMTKSALGLAESSSILGVAADNAAVGFTAGFVFHPSADGQGGNFWADRFKTAAVDAGTFAVMGGTSKAISNHFAPAEGVELSLSSRIARGSLTNAVAGLPGGFANAELQSFASGHGAARTPDILTNMAGYAMFGGALGTLEGFAKPEISKPVNDAQSEKLFPKFADAQLASGRENALSFMEQHRAATNDGTTMSLKDKFEQAGLNPTQQNRVLNSLAQVYENFAHYRGPDGKVDADQKGNWFHTLDEMDEVLESAKAARVSPAETERSLMAMFGDANKTKSNFVVHNLDGAQAARVVLGRQTDANFTSEHVHWIEEANKEHQIGPPDLMARIYTGIIRGKVNIERTAEFENLKQSASGGEPLNTADKARLEEMTRLNDEYERRNVMIGRLSSLSRPLSEEESKLKSFYTMVNMNGPFMTGPEGDALASLYAKISDPFSQPVERTASGGTSVQLTEAERKLLQYTGNNYWHVPDRSTPWYTESRIGIDADSKANYTRVGGFKKLLGLNGPETDQWFGFKTLAGCLDSPLQSYRDAYKVMTPDAQAQSPARIADTQAAIQRALGRTETWLRQQVQTQEWLQQPGKSVDETLNELPFWKTDLAYPNRDLFNDNKWWTFHRKGADGRTAEEQQFYNEHRYDGLNAQQIRYFNFAKEIRERMVNELGAEQRLDGHLPEDLKPVMSSVPGNH